MEYEVLTNSLSPAEFTSLFKSVGWGTPCEEQAAKALKNSLVVFSVEFSGKAVAMARVVGDGAMTFLIKDVVVHPKFQGKGVGRLLMDRIEEYISQQISPGWTAWAELTSAAGKEDFYRKCGFILSHEKGLGSGMMKKIRR